jgi:hypothetical protein
MARLDILMPDYTLTRVVMESVAYVSQTHSPKKYCCKRK